MRRVAPFPRATNTVSERFSSRATALHRLVVEERLSGKIASGFPGRRASVNTSRKQVTDYGHHAVAQIDALGTSVPAVPSEGERPYGR